MNMTISDEFSEGYRSTGIIENPERLARIVRSEVAARYHNILYMRAKMTRFLTSNQQKFSELLYYALCIFLIILVSACSDAQYISSETGSIAFSVEWRGAPQESSGRYAAALDWNLPVLPQ